MYFPYSPCRSYLCWPLHLALLPPLSNNLQALFRAYHLSDSSKRAKHGLETCLKEVKPLKEMMSTTPLLQLPSDLRDKIWNYCLGQEYIHIKAHGRNKLKHIVCSAAISDYDAHTRSCPLEKLPVHATTSSGRIALPPHVRPPGQYSLVNAIPREADSDYSYVNRHEKCHTEQTGQQLSLSFMRTCRVVYTETFEVLWGNNTFAFDRARYFNDFVETRTRPQRDRFRHLALKIDSECLLFYLVMVEMRHDSVASAVEELPALTSVYLDLGALAFRKSTLKAFWRYGLLEGTKDGLDILDAIRSRPNLQTILVHVGWVLKCENDWGGPREFHIGGRAFKRDLGHALDLRIMAPKLIQPNLRTGKVVEVGEGDSNLKARQKRKLEEKLASWKSKAIERLQRTRGNGKDGELRLEIDKNTLEKRRKLW